MIYQVDRQWAMPSSETFSIPPIAQFVHKYLSKSRVSVDPFSRNCGLATYTNDLNPSTSAQYHLDAKEFLALMVEKQVQADLIVFDPPYSLRQIKECYDSVGVKGTTEDMQAPWTVWKRLIDKMCVEDGIVLSFGWNTVGMGYKLGYEIVDMMLVCHGGSHNDTICMAEKKTTKQLSMF